MSILAVFFLLAQFCHALSLGSAIFGILPSFFTFCPCFYNLATLLLSYNSFPSNYIHFFSSFIIKLTFTVLSIYLEFNQSFKINYANTFGRIVNVFVSPLIMRFVQVLYGLHQSNFTHNFKACILAAREVFQEHLYHVITETPTQMYRFPVP